MAQRRDPRAKNPAMHHRLRRITFPMRARFLLILAGGEISRFPRTEVTHTLGSATAPGATGYRIEGGPRNHGPAAPAGGGVGENREGGGGEPECDAKGAGAKNRSEPFDGGPSDACASRRRPAKLMTRVFDCGAE